MRLSLLSKRGLLIFAMYLHVPVVHAQDRALRQPDWNDESVARANENFKDQANKRMFALPPGRDLSLPRWGFGKDVRTLDTNERDRARTFARAAVPMRWPECAKADPQMTHIRDETGVWYTDNYDFGCIIISVRGDRAFNPNLKIPGVGPSRRAVGSECDPGPEPPRRAKEHEGDHRRFELQLTLNRLPYTIAGECLEGAEEFCTDTRAQCVLVDRLIYLGGSKE